MKYTTLFLYLNNNYNNQIQNFQDNIFLQVFHKAIPTGSVFLWILFYEHYFMGRIAAIKYARKIVSIKSPIGHFMGIIEIMLQLSEK